MNKLKAKMLTQGAIGFLIVTGVVGCTPKSVNLDNREYNIDKVSSTKASVSSVNIQTTEKGIRVTGSMIRHSAHPLALRGHVDIAIQTTTKHKRYGFPNRHSRRHTFATDIKVIPPVSGVIRVAHHDTFSQSDNEVPQ